MQELYGYLMRIFRIFTPVMLIVLAAIVAATYLGEPIRIYDTVRSICYGYLIGWFGAWFNVQFWARRLLRDQQG